MEEPLKPPHSSFRTTLVRDWSSERDADYIEDYRNTIYPHLNALLEDVSLFAERKDLPGCFRRPLKLFIWFCRFMSEEWNGNSWYSKATLRKGWNLTRILFIFLSLLILAASIYQYGAGEVGAIILEEFLFIERMWVNKVRTGNQYGSMARYPHTNFILLWDFMMRRQTSVHLIVTFLSLVPALVESKRHLYRSMSYRMKIGGCNLALQLTLSFAVPAWLLGERLIRNFAPVFGCAACTFEFLVYLLGKASFGKLDFTKQKYSHRLRDWAYRTLPIRLTPALRAEAEQLYEWLKRVIDAFDELYQHYTYDKINPQISRWLILQRGAFKGYLDVLEDVLADCVSPDKRQKKNMHKRGPKVPLYVFAILIVSINCVFFWPFPITFATMAFPSLYILIILTSDVLSRLKSLTDMLLSVSFFAVGVMYSSVFVGIPAFVTRLCGRDDLMLNPALIIPTQLFHVSFNTLVADEPAFWIIRLSVRWGWISQGEPPGYEKRELLGDLEKQPRLRPSPSRPGFWSRIKGCALTYVFTIHH